MSSRFKGKYYSPKRRAIYAKGDDIDALVVFEMHGWVCDICKGPVDRSLRFPHKLAATIEHRTPLCMGGKHEWDNVFCAHAQCNFDKADSLPCDDEVK